MKSIINKSLIICLILAGLLVSCNLSQTNIKQTIPYSPSISPNPAESTQTHLPLLEYATVSPSVTATKQKTLSVTATVPTLPTVTRAIPTATQFIPVVQLTFVSDRSGKFGIYEVDVGCMDTEKPCSGEPQLLFEWDGWIISIDWSSNGKQVALISGRYSGTLYVVDWDGKNAVKITNTCGSASSPKWSPDGTKIAFIYADGQPGCEFLKSPHIQIYDLLTGKIITFLENAIEPSRIYWLPDNKFAYIARLSITNLIDYIFIVTADGKVVYKLPATAENYTSIFDADFSIDGVSFVFSGEIHLKAGKTTPDIYITTITGNEPVNLTNGNGQNFTPVWSPVGDWIAFQSDRSDNIEIYLIKPDGTNLFQITHNSFYERGPAWRNIK